MVKIQLDKSAVDALLTPEARLELQTIAYEKVAEEIVRKLGGTGRGEKLADDMSEAFRKRLSAIVDHEAKKFASQWNFPPEAKIYIEDRIADRVNSRANKIDERVKEGKDELGAYAQELVNQTCKIIDERAAKKVEEAISAQFASLKVSIREIAREEFFDVLRQAKEGTSFSTRLVSGDLVEKPGGYPFPGVFLGTFDKPDGTVMANAESLFHPGMIHVFPLRLLAKFDGTKAELIERHVAFIKEYHNG